MADRNQLRAARDEGYAATDPLAELTRLMGYDPRIQPTPPMDADLGIDLERELMGELDEGFSYVAANASGGFVGSAAMPADSEFDAALAANFEEELASAVDGWDPEPYEERAVMPVSKHSAVLDDADSAAVDMDFTGQLSSIGNEPVARTTRVSSSAAPDLEAELGALLGSLGFPETDERSGAAAQDEFDADFDTAFSGVDPYAASPRDYGPSGDHGAALNQDGPAAFEPVMAVAYGDEMPALSATEPGFAGYAEHHALDVAEEQAEPHDDIFEHFLPRIAQDAAEGETLSEQSYAAPMEDGFDEPAAESVADFEEQSVDALPDSRNFGYEPAETETEVEPHASGYAAPYSEPTRGYASATEQPFFDEDEFAAALGDEFVIEDDLSEAVAEVEESQYHPSAADYESAPPVNAPIADPFVTLALMGLPQEVDVAAESSAAGAAQEVPNHDNDPDDEGYAFQDGQDDESFAPDIDTVEVPEQAVALADDLNIPHVGFERPQPAAMDYDDLDPEFSGSYTDRPTPASIPDATDGDEFDGEFDRLFDLEQSDFADAAGASIAAGIYAPSSFAAAAAPSTYSAARGAEPVRQHDESFEYATDETLVYDPACDAEMAGTPSAPQMGARGPLNRGFMVAAVVAGLAFVGGVGALVYSVGGGEDGAPALVRADDSPVKVRPENPGGAVVPNQDNMVYERVTGGALEAPSQESLISGAEEPVDLAAQPSVLAPASTEAADDLPGVNLAPPIAGQAAELPLPKGEDRIEASPDIDSLIANDELAAVAPRRVRTMIVRPDGTLVPREEPAPVIAEPAAPQPDAGAEASPLPGPAASSQILDPVSAQPAGPAAQPAVAVADTDVAAAPAVLPSVESPVSGLRDIATEPALQDIAAPLAAAQGDAATPSRVPVAPSRPGDQPVDIVGEVRTRDQVASLDPQATAVASGRWTMQIASQPSPEGAQATYEDLARRYAGVLSGRGVSIVKAEIAGKGTFWRVRVPAGSRSDAIQLCENYRSAGGNCFVSQ